MRVCSDTPMTRHHAYTCVNGHAFAVVAVHALPHVATMCPFCERCAYLDHPPEPRPGQLEIDYG